MKWLVATVAGIVVLGMEQGRAATLSVELVGGRSTIFWMAIEDGTPFTSSDVASMSDGSLETGFVYTSTVGDDIDNPSAVNGIYHRFDFDISRFLSISRITFSWTGKHEWNPEAINPFPAIRLGVSSVQPLLYIDFGGQTDPTIRSGSIELTGSNLTQALNGAVASTSVSTDLGISYTLEFLRVETLEVSAEVTGVLAPVAVTSRSWGGVKSLYRD